MRFSQSYYQHGLHPYINIIFCLAVGSFFIIKKLLNPEGFNEQSRLFRFFVCFEQSLSYC
jgi:hypothetical protein